MNIINRDDFEAFVGMYSGGVFFCCVDGRVLVWDTEEEARDDGGSRAISSCYVADGPCPSWVGECLEGENYEVQ